jgi:serine/threonine-protein kinase
MNILRRRILLFLFALVLGFMPALQAQDDDKYAAIAYSPKTGKWGYGCNYTTKAEAIARAKSECGSKDARTNWCKNSWISLALSDKAKGGWGSAWGETREDAEAASRKECLDRNPDARIVVTVSATCEK